MWQAVPGYEGIYEANLDLRAVRSLDRVIMDRRGQFRCLRGRMLAGARYSPRTLLLSRNGISQQYTLDEIMEMTFSGAQISA